MHEGLLCLTFHFCYFIQQELGCTFAIAKILLTEKKNIVAHDNMVIGHHNLIGSKYNHNFRECNLLFLLLPSKFNIKI